MSVRYVFSLLLGGALLAEPCLAAASPDFASQYSQAVTQAVQAVQGSLVQLKVVGDFKGLNQAAAGISTGVLLDRQWVLTSRFGLEDRPKILIAMLTDGQQRSARIVSFDMGRNLALLRLTEPTEDEPPPLNSRTDAQPGETAIALGAVYSAKQYHLSIGIVSATERFLGRAVQTDAGTSPINYGGLLIDLNGRVLGIITPLGDAKRQLGATLYDSGIGFAVPWPDIQAKLARLQAGDDLHPGKAGVIFIKGNPLVTKCQIASVSPESPAAKAGFKPGDVIVRVAGKPVETIKHFQLAMGPWDAGDEVTLDVQVDTEVQTTQRKLTLVAGRELKQPNAELPDLLQRLKLDVPQVP